MGQITEQQRSLLGRLFRRTTLDPICVQEGAGAAKADARTNRISPNPHPKGTTAHKSWKKGYDKADDSTYVWQMRI